MSAPDMSPYGTPDAPAPMSLDQLAAAHQGSGDAGEAPPAPSLTPALPAADDAPVPLALDQLVAHDDSASSAPDADAPEAIPVDLPTDSTATQTDVRADMRPVGEASTQLPADPPTTFPDASK